MSLFGLDLGCDSSTVSIARRRGIDIALNEISKRETATVVSFGDGEKERVIGDSAVSNLTRQYKNTFNNLKRLIGVKYGSALHQHEKKYCSFETKPGKDGYIDLVCRVQGQDKLLPVEQVLAMFLVRMRKLAEKEAAVGRVVDAVVAVPCYWTAGMRRRFAASCAIAEFHLLNIMNETTAAGLAYGIARSSSLPKEESGAERLIIMDVGHSCTTISLVAFWREAMRVQFHVCDPYTGVRDMIQLIYEHYLKEVQTKYKVDLTQDKRNCARFWTAIEKSFRVLSANAVTNLNCELPDMDISFPSVTRDDWVAIMEPALVRTRGLVAEAMQKAGDVQTFEIIGGGSRIPAIRNLIKDATGLVPQTTQNATEVIAKGVALNGGMLSPKFSTAGWEFHIGDASSHEISAVYASEKSNTTISELPHLNKRVALVSLNATLPKALTLTFERSQAFDVAVVYDPSPTVEQSCVSVDAADKTAGRVIGLWKIDVPKNLPAPNADGKRPPVLVAVRLGTAGLVVVDSARMEEEYQEEVEYEEEVERMEVDGETEKPVKEKIKKKRMETKTRSLPCAVSQTQSLEIPASQIQEWRESERVYASFDEKLQKTAEAKNELESTCFDLRARLGDGGELAAYGTANEKSGVLAKCEEIFSWLDDEGWDAEEQDYVSRITALKSLFGPVDNRVKAFSALKETEVDAVKKIAATRAKVSEARYAHLTDEDKAAIATACESASSWVSQQYETLKSASLHADPPFTVEAVRTKLKEMDNVVNPLFSKPAPKPAKKEKEATSVAVDGEVAKPADDAPKPAAE